MKGVLQFCDEPVVSSDIIGNPHSSVFDSLVTQAKGDRYVRVLAGTTTSGVTQTAVSISSVKLMHLAD